MDRSVGIQIAENMRLVMRPLINGNIWNDPVTKADSLKRLHEMMIVVGYPDVVTNIYALDQLYADVRLL